MGRSIRLVVVALVVALAVAACGGKEPAAEQAAAPGVSAPTAVDGGTLAAGEKIAAPTGEVVLTVTGTIGEHNKGRRLEFDLASLERMRRVRLEAAEPFLKRRVMFEGVLLSDLLAVAGVPDSAMFGQVTFLTGNLVNVQREALLLNVEIEELAATHDLRGATLRRGLLGTQLLVMEGLGEDDPRVMATVRAIGPDLQLIDRALARAKADPTEANLATQVRTMRPAIRRVIFNVKDLYDAEEQGFVGALSGTLNARTSSERLLVGLSGLVLVVGLTLALSLRQRVRKDFARAYQTLTAEVEERKAAERALRASEERFRSLVQNSSDVISIVDADGGARLGGDEFAVLLERVTDADAAVAVAVAGRVLDTLHQPFGLNGRTIPIKASLGVAVGRPGADQAEELLRNADVAMYAAKAGGKDRYELFRPDMHEDMLQRLELEAELRHVADRDQLVLHYQPIVELVSGRITRVEALVRWDHPTKGLLSPPAFIPLAEEQGLIGPIGNWVLLQACLQARRWQDQFPDAPPLSVHVNLSGRQLEEQRLVGEVVHALETSRLSPRQLTLEITESVLVTDIETMSARLRELKGLGVLLAIDDFGTGYSSLSYLRRFPIDMLKIDKAFVDGVGRGREDTALAHAIVKLSHTLQLHTVAEGIEQASQAVHLAGLGCQDGQGVHFARPMPAAAMTELLAKSLADGGFHLSASLPTAESAAVP